MAAVMRRTQAMGMRSGLLAPRLTARDAFAHTPRAAPAKTATALLRGARLAAVRWVMSPHSARKTTPKLVPAIRGNDAGEPPWRAASTPSAGCGRKLVIHR